MAQHKWHKEIKAWADGKTIQVRWNSEMNFVKHDWHDCDGKIDWDLSASDFRIKPQPKEPQYLYVYRQGFEYRFSSNKENKMQFSTGFAMCDYYYVGKIKLEVDDV